MNQKLKTLAQLATPQGGGGAVIKLIVASGSVLVMVGAAALAAAAFAVLVAALAAIYLIATRILGIELAIDPRAFAQQYAARASA
jgi:hypothetical protein